MDKTPILIHPWEVARTAGAWIDEEALRNKEISVKLRELNNLIQLNADDELYVDLQLPSGIKPTDDFPVGVTTGRILQADWWQQSGTIINSKTTSGDYVRLIYANDGNLYYDPWTWDWIMIGVEEALDVNTKTFFLTGTTWAENIASAQEAIDWLMAGKDPLLMYNNRCYTLTKYNSTWESGYYVFATSVDTENVHEIQVWMGQWSQVSYLVGRTGTNYSWRTRTFMVRSWTWATARTQAQSVLNWYLMNDDDISVNKYNPIILSADANGSWQYTYHLTWVGTWVLIFTSLIVTGNAPSDYLLERIQINYSWNNVTSLQRNEYWLGQYSAGSWIVIDNTNHTISANIQWALVYKGNVATTANLPSSWNTVGDVYYVEADGLMYAWDGTAWKAVGNTQIDLSDYFNMTTNNSDDITAGTTNLFVTQNQINQWNTNTSDITTISNAITNIQWDITNLQNTTSWLVSDTAFWSSWYGDTTHAPSKNAIYDVLGDVETLLANL